MVIRPETPDDIENIRHINLQAFATDAEANLVDALRNSDSEIISLVAEDNKQLVGHILFSPVASEADVKIAGLAPMAVLPERQHQGIGSELIIKGLQVCKDAGYKAVVVLGHPNYYPRFGFNPSVNYGIQSEYDVPSDVFMIQELEAGVLKDISGTIKYHPIFNEF